VQAALPEEAPSDPKGHLKQTLGAAIDEADRWAQRRRIAADFGSLRELLSRI
jgi:hypothetical protein